MRCDKKKEIKEIIEVLMRCLCIQNWETYMTTTSKMMSCNLCSHSYLVRNGFCWCILVCYIICVFIFSLSSSPISYLANFIVERLISPVNRTYVSIEGKGWILMNMFCVLHQCCNQGIGAEEPWIPSQGGAGEPTARSGGARGTWWPAKSTVNATCTVEETVQESLWNFPHQLVLVVLDL